MSATSEYVEKYAEYAMEQQLKYGIPASVTLAQGILESANGKSQLARECNNHFGIKANKAWIDSGGQYGLYKDDKPNEKFCKYASVTDSFEHHSKILKASGRYADCFKLAATDYRGWCKGLQNGGYATANGYADSLISVIERMDLAKYDRMAVREAHYSFPVKRDEFLFVTSPFGMRDDPINPGTQRMHNGIDIRCKGDDLLATEDNGKVVRVNKDENTAGGKSVTVEYNRPDNTKILVQYMHMSEVAVKVGDTVNAGQKLGVSGNTGTRTTGEHLHFAVMQTTATSSRYLDPAAYLAEIAQKGDIKLMAMHNGQNLLVKYADQKLPDGQNNPVAIDPKLEPEDWMKKLLSSEDSGVNMTSADPIMDMVVAMFTSLMALAAQIDGKSRQDQLQLASDTAQSGQIDLRPLFPSLKACRLALQDGRNPLLITDSFTHELTNAEMQRLSMALGNKSEARVKAVLSNIITQEQMSRNFERQVGSELSQTLSMK